MTKKKRTQTSPFSLRLTYEERAKLQRAAADQTLGTYIRSQLFDERSLASRHEKIEDQKTYAQLLGIIGQSDLGKSLRELSNAAHSGSLVITPDTQVMLTAALQDVVAIKEMLLKELRVQSGAAQ